MSIDRLPKEYVCLSEFGVPLRQKVEVVKELRDLRRRIDKATRTESSDPDRCGHGTEEEDGRKHCLELVTFGSADLLTIHFIPRLQYLAVVNATAPVAYQRATGGVVMTSGDQCLSSEEGQTACDDDPSSYLLMSSAELLKLDKEQPFHSVVHLKIDPLVNLLAGDTVPCRLMKRLNRLVDTHFERFVLRAREPEIDPEAAAGLSTSNARKQLKILTIGGLDSAEVILVARSTRLEWLARLFWAMRSLRLRDIFTPMEINHRLEALRDIFDATEINERLDRSTLSELFQIQNLPREDWSARFIELPLLVYSSSIVGVPIDFVDGDEELGEDILQRVACSRALVTVRLRALPGGGRNTDNAINHIHQITRSGSTEERPYRLSLFGSHDILIGLGSYGSDTSERIAERQAGSLRAWTIGQIVRLLRAPPSVALEGSIDTVDYLQETSLAVMAFPAGFHRPDLVNLPPDKGTQAAFEGALSRARNNWIRRKEGTGDNALTSLYEDFIKAASKGCWSYTRTNGALNLIVSLVTLLANRTETENYLELVEPLFAWLKRANANPYPPNRDDFDRIYKHLDRMMHARSHRDSPTHQPGVSRAFEARAAYVLPRDAFHTYLRDVIDLRMERSEADNAPPAPILVDGTDSQLLIKYAFDTGIFYVSALRLHQPLLWPTIAHEVEHLRFRNCGCYEGMLKLQSELADRVKRRFGEQWHEAIRNLQDIGCDLAIVDSGVLVSSSDRNRDVDLLLRSLLATLWPNLAMELREQWYGGRPVARDGKESWAGSYKELWAHTYGFRLASVMALIRLDVSDPSDWVREGLNQVLCDERDRTSWRNAMLRLLFEACGRSRGVEFDDATRTEAREEPVVEETRCQLLNLLEADVGWVEALQALHGLRRSDRERAGSTSIPLVANYLRKIVDKLKEDEFVYPPLFPRGGMDPHKPIGHLANAWQYQLYNDMRTHIQRRRVKAILTFLQARSS